MKCGIFPCVGYYTEMHCLHVQFCPQKGSFMRRSPFLQKVSDQMMRRRYAKRTIETYLHWIKRYKAIYSFSPEASRSEERRVGKECRSRGAMKFGRRRRTAATRAHTSA